jgi:hypothetical protein
VSELTRIVDNFDVADQYADAVRRDILEEFGKVAVQECRRDCPVSAINDEGYVHMIDTIDYRVEDQDGTDQAYVEVFVLKDYASYVNFGNGRAKANPFFTNGMQRAEARLFDISIDIGRRQSTTVTSEAHDLDNNSGGANGDPLGGNVSVTSGWRAQSRDARGRFTAAPTTAPAKVGGSPLRASRGRNPMLRKRAGQ